MLQVNGSVRFGSVRCGSAGSVWFGLSFLPVKLQTGSTFRSGAAPRAMLRRASYAVRIQASIKHYIDIQRCICICMYVYIYIYIYAHTHTVHTHYSVLLWFSVLLCFGRIVAPCLMMCVWHFVCMFFIYLCMYVVQGCGSFAICVSFSLLGRYPVFPIDHDCAPNARTRLKRRWVSEILGGCVC